MHKKLTKAKGPCSFLPSLSRRDETAIIHTKMWKDWAPLVAREDDYYYDSSRTGKAGPTIVTPNIPSARTTRHGLLRRYQQQELQAPPLSIKKNHHTKRNQELRGFSMVDHDDDDDDDDINLSSSSILPRMIALDPIFHHANNNNTHKRRLLTETGEQRADGTLAVLMIVLALFCFIWYV